MPSGKQIKIRTGLCYLFTSFHIKFTFSALAVWLRCN